MEPLCHPQSLHRCSTKSNNYLWWNCRLLNVVRATRVVSGCIRSGTVSGQREAQTFISSSILLCFSIWHQEVVAKMLCWQGQIESFLKTGCKGPDTQPQELWQASKNFMWPSAWYPLSGNSIWRSLCCAMNSVGLSRLSTRVECLLWLCRICEISINWCLSKARRHVYSV